MEMSERERFDMFVESARAFCSWIEGLPELPSDRLWDLEEALALISALLADGHRLLASRQDVRMVFVRASPEVSAWVRLPGGCRGCGLRPGR